MNEPTLSLARESHPSHAHRFNNFLTLCMTHAEVALDSKDPAELETALQWILKGANAMAPERGPNRQHELAYEQRREAVNHG
jgi:hypothetical protein